jgi:hypothetical protein
MPHPLLMPSLAAATPSGSSSRSGSRIKIKEWQQQGLAAAKAGSNKGQQQVMQGVTAARAGGKGWYTHEQGSMISVQGVAASMDGINSRSGSSTQQQGLAAAMGGISSRNGSGNGWHQQEVP